MSAETVQPTHPGWGFWLLWMFATVVGAAAGIVLSIPLNEILVAALGANAKPPPWTATETLLIIVFKGAEGGMMGLGVGLGEWLVFRKHVEQARGWIIATGLAFFLQGAFRWSIPYDVPAAQVGVIITVSFGIFLGVCQWFALRGRVPNAGWWIPISVVGWIPALALILSPEVGGVYIEATVGMALLGLTTLMPFAVAGGGMVWLLRQAAPARQAVAS